MADLEDATTPLDTVDNSCDSDSSADEAPSQPIEWLATSRAKRSTAGTRMTSLIQQEAEDDELELLFAEDENDEGFEMEGGDDSDVQMDSSDDDDDNGPPAAGVEELDGEKELMRKERQERTKKRKNDHLPKSFQAKRAKIDPSASKKTPPRPKKKSERASWIPTLDEAPVRVSHRSTTMDAKERLYKEMEERERKRLKQLANMERAAAKKAAEKRPEKTQEDRLAEAARIEKANAKSLNRWEEAERIREEEARARLEALHNRKMEGPVITWWSGKATYVGDKLKQVGKHVQVEEPPVKVPRKKRPSEMGLGDSATAKARLERQMSQPKSAAQLNGQPSAPSSGQGTPSKGTSSNAPAVGQAGQPPNAQPLVSMQATPAMLNGSAPLSGLSAPPSAPGSPFPKPQHTATGPLPAPVASPQLPPPPPPPPTPAAPVTSSAGNVPQAGALPLAPPPSATSHIQNSHIQNTTSETYNAMPTPNGPVNAPSNAPDIIQTPAAQPSAGQMPPLQTFSTTAFSPQPTTNTFNPPSTLAQPATSSASPQVKSEQSSSMPPSPFTPSASQQPQQTSQTSALPHGSPAPPAMPPPPPPPTTHATTSRIILSSFHEPSLRDKSTITAILFKGNRFTKLPRPAPPPVCAITGLPAKFRDPKTGLPYVNSYAFKEIRRLERGEYRWSGLLGAYVGGVDRVVGVGPQARKVEGAASGVPARFTDPKAPPPPKVVKQEVKPVSTPVNGTPSGNMAPPPTPVPQMPNTPTPMHTPTPIQSGVGTQQQQPVGTPRMFEMKNGVLVMPPGAHLPYQAPNKQIAPPILTPKKVAAQAPPATMQSPAPVVAQNKPLAPAGAPAGAQASAPPPRIPASGVVAATTAPIASTVATVAPIAAPVAATVASPAPIAALAPPPPAQPKA